MDSAFRLVSGSQGALVPSREGAVGGRFRPRIRESERASRAPGIESVALHVRVAERTHQDDGSLHDASGGAVDRAKGRGDVVAFGLRASLDVFPDICAEARVLGWGGGSGNSEYGGFEQFLEVCQGSVHELREMTFLTEPRP